MIDQTLSLRQLTGAMARCVREWLLPDLRDPLARIQAEQLADLLEGLPDAYSPAAGDAIRADSEATIRLFEELGESPARGGEPRTIDELMEQNAALKRCLLALADAARSEDRDRLDTLRRFFLESGRREVSGTGSGSDFAEMSAKERAPKRRE